MATLLDLVEQNRLIKLDPQLGWREQEERLIYAFPRVTEWLDRELPDEVSNWNLDEAPIEQAAALVADFCSGAELTIDRQVKPIRHISHGVWELKSADIRLFGWFARRDCFICTAGNTTYKVKTYSLYNGYRDEAVRLREQLELDEPKYVPGDDPNGVLSDWCYPPS